MGVSAVERYQELLGFIEKMASERDTARAERDALHARLNATEAQLDEALAKLGRQAEDLWRETALQRADEDGTSTGQMCRHEWTCDRHAHKLQLRCMYEKGHKGDHRSANKFGCSTP